MESQSVALDQRPRRSAAEINDVVSVRSECETVGPQGSQVATHEIPRAIFSRRNVVATLPS